MTGMSVRRRRLQRHGLRTVVALIAFGTLLASGTPALAAADPGRDGSRPQPGSSGAPRPAGSAGKAPEGSFVAGRASGGSGAAGTLAIPDPDVEAPGCNAYVMAWSDPHPAQVPQSVGPPEPVTVADMSAWGEFDCTAGLLSLYARTDIVDRQYPLTLASGLPHVKSNWGGGVDASTAYTSVVGDYVDYGRVVEGTLDLTMRLRGGWKWLSCSPPPTNRLLLCVGLNTSTLHVILGTYPFSSGLEPPANKWVALGDSYASGTNADFYDATPSTCRRSVRAYSRVFNGFYLGGKRLKSTTRACHGAVISDITGTQPGTEGPQIDAVYPTSTRLVTLQIGGNDLGFGSTLTACVLETGPCVAPSAALLEATRVRLIAVYQLILSRLQRPDARLVVLTYPKILPDTRPACGEINTPLTQPELDRMNAAWRAAHDMIVSAVNAVSATNSKIRLMDVYDDFAGHLVCAPPAGNDVCGNAAWANALTTPPSSSFHPNGGGHCAIGRRLQLDLNFTLAP